MARRRATLSVWIAGGGGALAALVVFGLASHAARASVGRPAPALPREHLAGPPATLAEPARRRATGGPSLVVFWASWCGPCAREAPALERFSRSAAGRGRVVGVDWSDALSGARSFIRHYAWTFPNLRDARRHRRQRLPPDRAADHVRARRPRPHPRRAARTAGRRPRWSGRSRAWARAEPAGIIPVNSRPRHGDACPGGRRACVHISMRGGLDVI